MNGVLVISALLVAAEASIAHKKITVTNEEIKALASDFAEHAYQKEKKAEPIQSEANINQLNISVKTEDFDLITQMQQYEAWLGDVEPISVSSNLTDSALSISLNRTYKNVKIQGQIKLTGTVKGKPTDQIRNITIKWNLLRQQFFLRLVYSDRHVSLRELRNDWDVGTPTMTIEGVSFEGVSSDEIAQAVLQKHMEVFKETQDNMMKDNKRKLIASLNMLMARVNLQEFYDSLRDSVPVYN